MLTNELDHITPLHDTYWVPCHIEVADDGVFLHMFDGDFIFQIKDEPSCLIVREGKHRLAFARFNNNNLEVDLMPSTKALQLEGYTLAVEYWEELKREIEV